jgi:hypothetical protein
MTKTVSTLFFCFALVQVVGANGTYDFLNIPTGARSVAMGGAFTAVADDPSGVHWNPAGAAAHARREVALEYNHYVVGMKRGYLGYVHPLGQEKSLAVAVNYISIGTIQKTNLYGDEEGTFSPLQMAVSVGYSTAVMERPSLTMGAALKWIYGSIDEFTSHGLAVDLGVIYVPGPEGLTLGLSVQNLGAQLKAYGEESEALPLNVSVGGAYFLLDGDLRVAADLRRPSDGGAVMGVGTEWFATSILTTRLGYNTLGSDWKSGSEVDIIGGFTFGVGLAWKRLMLDLSVMPMVELGNPIWISTRYSL